MKKFTKLIVISLMSLLVISCSHNVNSYNNKNENENIEYGSATLKMFIPDYYLLAEAGKERVISPQTASVQLSAYNTVSNQWDIFEKLDIEAAEKTAVEDAPEGFSGSMYQLVFSKVYAKTYTAGTLKVELLSAAGVLLSSGTNATAVTVRKGENSNTSFYTLPSDSTKKESSLSAGEMKFCSFTLAANTHYTLHMDVSGSVYPDIVVFNEDGTLAEYYVIDDEDSCEIDFPAGESTSVKYIGVWADDGTNVSKYSVNLYTDLTDFTFKDSKIGFWGGESYQVNLAPVPDDAYLGKPTYTSSNEKITVSENGVITGNEEAEGVITVSYKGISHTIAVNVYESATELTGVLSGDNLHWTKENGPYKVTGNVLIEETDRLIIDPGVAIYFTGNYYIKMNGTINAVGTEEEPIIFTKSASYAGVWGSLRINGGRLTVSNSYKYNSGNILKYVDFSYASTPVNASRGVYINHCNFRLCSNRVYAESGSVIIDNYFENGLSSGGLIVNNRIKDYLQGSNVINNTVENASLYLESASFNNFIGCSFNSVNGGINNNNFINFTGTIIGTTSSRDSTKQYDYTNNYWGERQTVELTEKEETGDRNMSFISDYRDDFNYTEINYSGWKSEPIEEAGYLGDAFIDFGLSYETVTYGTNADNTVITNLDLNISVDVFINTNEIVKIRMSDSAATITEAVWNAYTTGTVYPIQFSNISQAPIIYVQLQDAKGNITKVRSIAVTNLEVYNVVGNYVLGTAESADIADYVIAHMENGGNVCWRVELTAEVTYHIQWCDNHGDSSLQGAIADVYGSGSVIDSRFQIVKNGNCVLDKDDDNSFTYTPSSDGTYIIRIVPYSSGNSGYAAFRMYTTESE